MLSVFPVRRPDAARSHAARLTVAVSSCSTTASIAPRTAPRTTSLKPSTGTSGGDTARVVSSNRGCAPRRIGLRHYHVVKGCH
jgi:hypothetical protein